MDTRQVLRTLENGVATVLDLVPATPTDREIVLGRQLAERLQALSREGAVGSGSPFWREICAAMAELAAKDDPRFFMRWEPIRATMVHGATTAIIGDWWMLRRSAAWQRVWRPALRHRQFGHPPPFLPMLSTNAMTVEHATHLFHFHADTGRPFTDGHCVIEFGGGYGSMCRLVHALGFAGTYVIFDLPHILALQQYYLGLHGIIAGEAASCQVRLCSDLDTVKTIIDSLPEGGFSVISTWALSEMPLDLRSRIEAFLAHPRCEKALLAYQATFEGNDNRAYFTGLIGRTSDSLGWIHRPVGQSPALALEQARDCYLFGTPRPA